MIDLSKFSRPALQFSGGKDSLACLYLLKEKLDGIQVYWLNTGDGCPETLDVIKQCREWIPNFVEVRSTVKAWREANGAPSDLVPAQCHSLGVAYGMSSLHLSNRFDCCFHNLMAPMHLRMVEDKIDCVIRGTKLADTGKLPVEGQTGFYEVVLPLRDWTHDEVFYYLKKIGAPQNAIYEYFKSGSAPECLGCTAWWDDGKARYLKARHPAEYKVYALKLLRISKEVQQSTQQLRDELQWQ